MFYFRFSIIISTLIILTVFNSYADVQPSELKLGGIYYTPKSGGIKFKGAPDFSLQYLFSSLFVDNDKIYSKPRIHVGCALSSNKGINQYYSGLTWHIPFHNLFLELGLGGAVHSGKLKKKPNYKFRALGSRILFRESIAFGVNFGSNINASLIIDHVSNANIAPPNCGLTGIGVQIGYKF